MSHPALIALGPMTGTLLHLASLPAPIHFAPGCEEIAACLADILKGWPARIDEAAARPAQTFIEVRRRRDGYFLRRTEDGWTSIEDSPVGAACWATIEIIDGFVKAAGNLAPLHAGAVEFAGRLVLFPATNHAGKSTLVTRLGAAGLRVFADDILPVDLATGEAVATGCLPRPRVPLPGGVTRRFADFVARASLHRDDRYAYVDPGPDARAGHGERLDVGAVVLLRRQEGVRAKLRPAAAEDVLWTLLSQDIRTSYRAREAVDFYLGMTRRIICHELDYSDLEEAAECLVRHFSHWPEPAEAAHAELQEEQAPPQPLLLAEGGGGPLFRQAEKVSLRSVGRAGFLVNEETQAIFNLNEIGRALWQVLGQPASRDGLVGLFCDAFPDTPPQAIAADIDALLAQLRVARLVETVDAPS